MMDRDAGCYYLGASGANDWDLNAVVRYACRGRVPPPPPPSDDPFSPFFHAADLALPVPDAAASLPDLPLNGGASSVDELSIAFFAPSAALPASPQPLPLPLPQPPLPDVEMVQLRLDEAVPPPPPMLQAIGQQLPVGEGSRSKRKKKQVKKVVKRVAADGTSADPWAWRKYGQKPIKGSPYPRGYYRCSTDKACEARKMVERCRDDPNSFILTYTGGDHSHPAPAHRNSLAGTTRNRQAPEPAAAAGRSAPVAQATEAASAAAPEPSPGQSTSGGLSPTTPLRTPSMEEYNQDEEFDEAAGGTSQPPKEEVVEMAPAPPKEEVVETVPAPAKDVVETGREDELMKLLQYCVSPGIGGDDSGTVVENTFVVTPWMTALGDAAGWS